MWVGETKNDVWEKWGVVGGEKNDKQKKTCARVYVAATEGSENQEAYDGASPVVITSRYGENGEL